MHIRDLMDRINNLQESTAVVEEYSEPVVEVHPLVAAMRELQQEGILEGTDEEHHTGGGKGLPFPGSYEQEYDMFKSRGPRRITAMTNEALDSSYPYEGNSFSGRYTFETEEGVFYKVYFQGRDLVEVAFSAILPGEEELFRPDKTTLTGTGNSRKVFGTVVKIVKDFLENQEPKALYFTAEGSEPSRIRLYNAMIAQVDKELPNYYAANTVDLGDGKAYMLKRKEGVTENSSLSDEPALAKGTKNRASGIFESTISLADIYDGSYPDSDELIWNYVGDSDFDIQFEVNTIQPFVLDQMLCNQYGVDDLEDLFHKMQPEQEEIISDYQNDPNLSQQVIVLYQDRIIDGNHRALAAALSNKSIKYIDVSEEPDNEEV